MTRLQCQPCGLDEHHANAAEAIRVHIEHHHPDEWFIAEHLDGLVLLRRPKPGEIRDLEERHGGGA